MWIERGNGGLQGPESVRRAVASAWLDEVRDALTEDHRRWRADRVEGVAPLDGRIAQRIARGTDKAIGMIEKSLEPIRGREPIPAIAVVALASKEDYYSFISHFYPEQGEFATSGGVYLNEGADSFPVIALPASNANVEQVIAHELTHHALFRRRLPLWVEEGITQMMEERVTGISNFRLDHEMLRRHRERWLDGGLDPFLSGEAFHSAEDDQQELAYHLSQFVVRGALSKSPEQFFAFLRGCKDELEEKAAARHLRCDPREFVEYALGAEG